MTIYWLMVLFSLSGMQQVGHSETEYSSAEACLTDAAFRVSDGLFPLCVFMIKSPIEQQQSGAP